VLSWFPRCASLWRSPDFSSYLKSPQHLGRFKNQCAFLLYFYGFVFSRNQCTARDKHKQCYHNHDKKCWKSTIMRLPS
jgi:hypothetical protein